MFHPTEGLGVITRRLALAPAPDPAPDRRLELAADGTMSVAEAMKFLGLGITEVYAMTGRGEIAYRKAGRRRLVFRRSLVEWLAAGAVVEPT